MSRMLGGAASSATVQPWLESLGDWRWPWEPEPSGAEPLPPSWVPALPLPAGGPGTIVPGAVHAPRRLRGALPALMLAALAALGSALALRTQSPRVSDASLRPRTGADARHAAAVGSFSLAMLPQLEPVSHDAAGSVIAHVGFNSVSLHAPGGFLVYLPPRFDSALRYPVLYLLHGNEQLAVEFLLQGDLQGELDRLIGARQVPPMIAVMPERGQGAINWRNLGAARWESYVVEVQELVDRMLPTIPERDARAIAGDSMGAYGAMNLALDNPYRFGVVESWLGFFNGLEPQLRMDAPVIRKLGLTAFVYGAAQDHIANPDEDAPFAAALRANGAHATSAIYQGEHNMQTVQEHIASQLLLVGRVFRQAERRAGRR